MISKIKFTIYPIFLILIFLVIYNIYNYKYINTLKQIDIKKYDKIYIIKNYRKFKIKKYVEKIGKKYIIIDNYKIDDINKYAVKNNYVYGENKSGYFIYNYNKNKFIQIKEYSEYLKYKKNKKLDIIEEKIENLYDLENISLINCLYFK